MKLQNLFQNDDIETFDDDLEDMDLSDALFVLSEMLDDDKLTSKEISIIEDMFDRLFDEEDDIIEQEITETSQTERLAAFKHTKMSDRLKNRIYQRKYRKRSDVKAKLRKKAEAEKRCKGKNRSAQIATGTNNYVCKLKNKFKSKLMKRVAERYN